MRHPTDTPCPRARLFWLSVIELHFVAAVGVWVAMPGGFPVGHPHFWANRVLPVIVAAYAIFTTLAALRRRWRLMVGLMLCSPIALVAGAVSGELIFPISGRWVSVAVMAAALLVVTGLRREFRPWWPTRGWLAGVSIIPIVIGLLLPLTQRSPLPSTHPDNNVLTFPATQPMDRPPNTQHISDQLSIVPNTGELQMNFGRRAIYLSPLLTFESRSPDRCWTNLAPKAQRTGPQRQLYAATPGVFRYLDDGQSVLGVNEAADGSIRINAMSVLPEPVYSHLNTFTELTILGHRKLALIFSPAPKAPIDVTYGEYPTGLPARSAYVDAAGVFHIVQATSGEKGPFKELARGPLGNADPLSITLLDDHTPFARVTLLDFSSQAGRQLSPTAGWGLPVNAIEFSLYDNVNTSAAGIFISLAATSVGRGWDSVGHAAGTYRNQIIVERLGDSH